jgi:hypothetical protein
MISHRPARKKQNRQRSTRTSWRVATGVWFRKTRLVQSNGSATVAYIQPVHSNATRRVKTVFCLPYHPPRNGLAIFQRSSWCAKPRGGVSVLQVYLSILIFCINRCVTRISFRKIAKTSLTSVLYDVYSTKERDFNIRDLPPSWVAGKKPSFNQSIYIIQYSMQRLSYNSPLLNIYEQYWLTRN